MIFSNYLSYFANTTKRIISFSYSPLKLLWDTRNLGPTEKAVAALFILPAIALTLLFNLPVAIVALVVHTLAMALISPFVVAASIIELGVNIVRPPLPKPIKWGDHPVISSSNSIFAPASIPRVTATGPQYQQVGQPSGVRGFFGLLSKKSSSPMNREDNILEQGSSPSLKK